MKKVSVFFLFAIKVETYNKRQYLRLNVGEHFLCSLSKLSVVT